MFPGDMLTREHTLLMFSDANSAIIVSVERGRDDAWITWLITLSSGHVRIRRFHHSHLWLFDVMENQ